MQDMPLTSSSIGYGPQHHHHHPPCPPKNDCCRPPAGGLTVLRINIPAGAVINLLNLIEVSSPAGICLIVRVPILGGCSSSALSGIMDSIKQAGGNVEVVS